MATIGEVRVRRVYDKPDDNDGVRVLVDRIWPRGMTKVRGSTGRVVQGCGPVYGAAQVVRPRSSKV